jgi:hypothetical protein
MRRRLVCIHLKPCISGLMVAHWSAVNFTEIGLYHLITAVSYVHKAWNDIGCLVTNKMGKNLGSIKQKV